MVDAKNVLTLVHDFISSKQTRHISRRELVVREREVEGYLRVTKLHTSENLADLFTKVLDREPFTTLRRGVMNILVRAATMVLPRARRMAAAAAAPVSPLMRRPLGDASSGPCIASGPRP